MAEPRPGTPGVAGSYAGINHILRNFRQELYRIGILDMRTAARNAMAAGALGSAGIAHDFALALEQTTRYQRSELSRLYHELGLLMQESVIEAYVEAHARGRNIAPYRLGDRDAGGLVLRALSSPEFFRATNTGLLFINEKLLNDTARQWHRLNFGAAPNAGVRPAEFQVSFDGLVVGAIGLHDAPSKGFSLPFGVFKEGAFLHPRGPQRFPTKGIQAWNFLDAGYRTFARGIGPAYSTLYRGWYESAKKGTGPLSRVAKAGNTVAAPRAAPFAR